MARKRKRTKRPKKTIKSLKKKVTKKIKRDTVKVDDELMALRHQVKTQKNEIAKVRAKRLKRITDAAEKKQLKKESRRLTRSRTTVGGFTRNLKRAFKR